MIYLTENGAKWSLLCNLHVWFGALEHVDLYFSSATIILSVVKFYPEAVLFASFSSGSTS